MKMKTKKNIEAVMLLTLAIILMVANGSVAACTTEGGDCSSQADCCEGTVCKIGTWYYTCKWCPGDGASCGLLQSCCPGYTCDHWLNGKCHKV
ncbi:hypothetical protein RDABS01_032731 [Bienertia sinuspersici]